jgi:hypothetical protein
VPEPIDVTDWRLDPEYPVFPEGSRDKTRLICPDPSPHPELIPNHRYLYKLSIRRHPVQFWSEVVASRLGDLVGIAVPRTFVAFDSSKGNCGALIEWFYGKPGGPPQLKVDGGDYMQRFIRDFDFKKGTQHNFRTVQEVFQLFQANGDVHPNWPSRWGEVFLFDALIGNTDRHQNNWALVWTYGPEGRFADLAPAFDNGTSLGYEILDGDISGFMSDQKRLDAYVSRGTHHMRWELDLERTNHAEFLRLFSRRFPDVMNLLSPRLMFSVDELRQVLNHLATVELSIPLTSQRLEFMLRLIETRRLRLLDALHG